MKHPEIDHGNTFDWGSASKDYAVYRDIYPKEFYEALVERGLCVRGQEVLDLGTGTGVLPRGMAQYGAHFTGVDAAENQILEAVKLAREAGLNQAYYAVPAEQIAFEENSFDVATACQCFFYFDEKKLLPRLSKALKPGGRLAILYMAWLPGESEIASGSEELVLRYNPGWTGGGEVRHELPLSEELLRWFELTDTLLFDLQIPFTRESWGGRMRACRGVGASLEGEELQKFDREHRELLERIAPPEFTIPHYASMRILKVKK